MCDPTHADAGAPDADEGRADFVPIAPGSSWYAPGVWDDRPSDSDSTSPDVSSSDEDTDPYDEDDDEWLRRHTAALIFNTRIDERAFPTTEFETDGFEIRDVTAVAVHYTSPPLSWDPNADPPDDDETADVRWSQAGDRLRIEYLDLDVLRNARNFQGFRVTATVY